MGLVGLDFWGSTPQEKCTKAVLSEIPNQKQYPKDWSQSTGPIPPSLLIQVVEIAAKIGADV